MIEVTCPECKHVQRERSFEDKRGWECKRCGRAWETMIDGETRRHPLAGTGAVRTVDDCIEEWPVELQ